MTKIDGLNARQRAFCREYVIDRNGRAAYQRAGFKATGHSAEVNAEKLLRKTEVKNEVARLEAEVAERAAVTATEVVRHAADMGFIDLGDLFDETGMLKPVHKMPEKVRRILAGVELTSVRTTDGEGVVTVTHKVKLPDRNAALDKLFRHLGLYNDKMPEPGNKLQEMLKILGHRPVGPPSVTGERVPED